MFLCSMSRLSTVSLAICIIKPQIRWPVDRDAKHQQNNAHYQLLILSYKTRNTCLHERATQRQQGLMVHHKISHDQVRYTFATLPLLGDSVARRAVSCPPRVDPATPTNNARYQTSRERPKQTNRGCQAVPLRYAPCRPKRVCRRAVAR